MMRSYFAATLLLLFTMLVKSEYVTAYAGWGSWLSNT